MTDEKTYGFEEFEQYIRQGEPDKKQKAENWSIAIGLQAVDGLHTSSYLRKTAIKNIEGEITGDDVKKLINTYYKSKTVRTADDDITEEADKVSANISNLLNEPTFAFTYAGLLAVHRRIFSGVFSFAGKIRDYNITKKEWVLDGETVRYVSALDLKDAVEYDLEKERKFSYKGLSSSDVINHLTRFVADLWQITSIWRGQHAYYGNFHYQVFAKYGF